MRGRDVAIPEDALPSVSTQIASVADDAFVIFDVFVVFVAFVDR